VDTAAAAAELSAIRTGDAAPAAMATIRGNAVAGPIAGRATAAWEADALGAPMIGYATPGVGAHMGICATKAGALRRRDAAPRATLT
jgi:hypothetical protein